MRKIVRGHRAFFLALMDFLRAGHAVTLIQGNHDVELYWPEVQTALLEEMQALADGEWGTDSGLCVADHMDLRHWFYLKKDVFSSNTDISTTTVIHSDSIWRLECQRRSMRTERLCSTIQPVLFSFATCSTNEDCGPIHVLLYLV